jgi:hypothetical protein
MVNGLNEYRYPLVLLIIRAVVFTLAPIYMMGTVIWAIGQGRLNWWALLFWIVLAGLFFWHGIACCGEVRRRWRESASRTKGKH